MEHKRVTVTQIKECSSCKKNADILLPEFIYEEPIEWQQELGRGGMGVVHEGIQHSMKRTVALKSLNQELQGFPSAKHALVCEAQVLALLEHPNIVPVYSLNYRGKAPVIVLKKITGVRWSDLMFDSTSIIERFGLSLQQWNLNVLLKVMDAIQFAHSKGILHLDLKPSNVMIGEYGEVYVVDWGNAVSIDEEYRGTLTMADEKGVRLGSPAYMAPEMLLNTCLEPISKQTDVYLLGAILYEIISGVPPHLAETEEQEWENVKKSEPCYSFPVPRELSFLLISALCPTQKDRVASIESFSIAIRTYLSHQCSRDFVNIGNQLGRKFRKELLLGSEVDKKILYDIFGQIKLTFKEALTVWPGNAEARDAYRNYVLRIARFELGNDDPGAALGILHSCGILDNKLSEQVKAKQSLQVENARRVAEIRRHASVEIQVTTRRRTVASVGLLWVIIPLLVHFLTESVTYSIQAMLDISFLVVWFLIGRVAKKWILSTAINQKAYETIFIAGVSGVCINMGSWIFGNPAATSQFYHLFIFFVAALNATISIDRRIWPTMVAFFCGFIVSANSPSICWVSMSITNVVLFFNISIIWSQPAARKRRCENQSEIEGVHSWVF